ncbi:GSCOCG00004732001-RA-CDS [Cotesia congregata]|nr:GSCOCG00004732001-RA-CDS [Cotesia congregata]
MIKVIIILTIVTCACSRPASFNSEKKITPFSTKTLESMLEKAILKIITGELSNGDLLLLRSLNYSLEEVLEIRERELAKKEDNLLSKENFSTGKFEDSDGVDVAEYNRQAVLDYETLANKMEEEKEEIQEVEPENEHLAFDKAMEPHVVFKIRFNETEDQEGDLGGALPNLDSGGSTPRSELGLFPGNRSNENDANLTRREYEGLEWVEDDVYRVIPEALDQEILQEFKEEQEEEEEEKVEKLGDYAADQEVDNANLSAYQQLALAHRRDGNHSGFDSQGQKAIEDIKLRVLAMTGRFNLSTSDNQVQRERLTMFTPTCEIPKNTDAESWIDPFSMNMFFQLNLTAEEHIVAAKLRLFKLPQNETLATTSSPSEEEDGEEKKVRISIYYYMRSLKKYRCSNKTFLLNLVPKSSNRWRMVAKSSRYQRKKLMDSVVTPLTSEGSHLALDVRQALRYWRQAPKVTSGTNNHGLVVQVEDQDGRPLKPGLFIQRDGCQEENSDNKAYQRVPALFFRACSRYVRVVNEEAVTYVDCSHRHRSARHRNRS